MDYKTLVRMASLLVKAKNALAEADIARTLQKDIEDLIEEVLNPALR